MLSVRLSEPADAGMLEELYDLARASLGDRRGGERRRQEVPPHVGDWCPHLGGVDAAVAVASVDDVVLGWIRLTRSNDSDVVTIDSIYVDQGARELGLGDELMAWALEWTRRQGARSLESWALPGDRETKNLFERHGLTARLIVVSRDL